MKLDPDNEMIRKSYETLRERRMRGGLALTTFTGIPTPNQIGSIVRTLQGLQREIQIRADDFHTSSIPFRALRRSAAIIAAKNVEAEKC
jgi:hypothetical protein